MYWALWKSPCYNLCVCVGGQGGMYCLWVTKILLICKDKISCVDTCTFFYYIFISYYHVCVDVRVVHEIYKQQWWFPSIWTVAFTSIGTECIGYSPLRLMCWLLARESFISSSNRCSGSRSTLGAWPRPERSSAAEWRGAPVPHELSCPCGLLCSYRRPPTESQSPGGSWEISLLSTFRCHRNQETENVYNSILNLKLILHYIIHSLMGFFSIHII